MRQQSKIIELKITDKKYPKNLLKLKNVAPKTIYLWGNLELLFEKKIGVTGARKADYDSIETAKKIGVLCAQQKICVVSGGAKGVDQAVVSQALLCGGDAIVVVPYGLGSLAFEKLKTNVMRFTRNSDSVLFVSKEKHEAVFSAYYAHERNAIIYALSEGAVAVSAPEKKGGTFSGALNCIEKKLTNIFTVKRNRYSEEKILLGNQELVKKGAKSIFESEVLENNLNLDFVFRVDFEQTEFCF